MSEEWLGCGVATHDPDCLCDVVITNPLPPLEECFKNAVDDMWMGRELCDLKGYSRPWTDKVILDYLQDLETFYDAYHAQTFEREYKTIHEMEPFNDEQHNDPLFVQWGWIRESMQYAMDKFDNCLIDVIDALCLTPQQAIDGLTTGRGGEGWTLSRINKLDLAFMESNLNFASMAKDLKLPLGVVRGLRKYWEQRRNRYVGCDNPARRRMQWLCRNTDLTPKQIVDIVHREHGFIYANSTISKWRRRNLDNKKD